MTTTHYELLDRMADDLAFRNRQTVSIELRSMARPWWQVLTVRTWYGFGMRNITVRFRGVVVLKLAVR